MSDSIAKLVIKSARYHKKAILYQIIIIGLLSAVISGSMLTGWSVRASLKKTSSERLGNTGILISSGSRFCDPNLAGRLNDVPGISCTGLLELNGLCQNLSSQKVSKKIHIYGVPRDFFRFHGQDSINILPGEAAINESLASYLGLAKGDELIVRYNAISDIPSDAPFAPSKGEALSIVLRVSTILKSNNYGNFSLSINQVVPENIFINLNDIFTNSQGSVRINRLLISRMDNFTMESAQKLLKSHIKPEDMGIRLVTLPGSGGTELRTNRIFIESDLIDEVKQSLPEASPLLTYLGNRFQHGSKVTPYSFIAALPRSLYPGVPEGRNMVVNRWLASDLGVAEGDTLRMSWFAPDSLNRLLEKSDKFRISRIVDIADIWADSLLMPEFPGISGSATCSGWDAGVPVNLKEIRQKDEDYWKKYRGTPKAFISYETGTRLWGSNFGKATAIRFPVSLSGAEIAMKLTGAIDPFRNGFTITDIYNDSLRAASESVDFSSLFLSLGFFLILASIVLLSFAVSSYLDAKRGEIRTFSALGFRPGWIQMLIMTESVLIALTGAVAGSFTGILVCKLIISLLNTVWHGAVQTNTLESFFSLSSVLTGLLISFGVTCVFQTIRIRKFLKYSDRNGKSKRVKPLGKGNPILLTIAALTSLLLFVLSLYNSGQEMNLCFASGTVLMITIILFIRQYLLRLSHRSGAVLFKRYNLSALYYSCYPSHAIMPVLFISTGIFAVFITGANRMMTGKEQMKPSGGTGGFILWCENSIPIRADLTTTSGISSSGLDDEPLTGLKFIQLKRFAGDDASCLNLNHVSVPPLLGAASGEFIKRGSFSFATVITGSGKRNPWEFILQPPVKNTIFGIADQTVLEWGLKVRPGDTLVLRAESGQRLNIVLAAGLKPSIFQGYVIIGLDNFRKYFPSVTGSSVMLVDGPATATDTIKSALADRLESYGASLTPSAERLASFYEVTNTYLSVFGVFGALGMVTGIAGLGFVLLRNYNYRRKEFALLLATGYSTGRIRIIIFSEQLVILICGILSGVLSAMVATLPSLRHSPDIPWLYLGCMIAAILITGNLALLISMRAVTAGSLRESLHF